MKDGSYNVAIEFVFNELLPYYYEHSDDLPQEIKLILLLNHWGSVFHACQDIALHLTSGCQSRRLQRSLRHAESFGRPEP